MNLAIALTSAASSSCPSSSYFLISSSRVHVLIAALIFLRASS